MPREFPRSRRIEEAIKRIVSQALSRKARDPRLEGVVITEVSVSHDLSVANVYYAHFAGTTASVDAGSALQAASGFFRSTVARELRAKHVPELRFRLDVATARGRTLADLIDRAVASDRDHDREKTSGDEGSA